MIVIYYSKDICLNESFNADLNFKIIKWFVSNDINKTFNKY